VTDIQLLTPTTIAVVRPRPPLDRWLRDRDLDDAAGGALFGCSKQMVNGMRKPFDDPSRATRGELRPEDFSPPVADILRGASA